MKKIATFLLLLAVSVTIFCQQNNARADLTKKDYLKKSRSQKTGAWILLGTGTAMTVIGVMMWSDAPKSNATLAIYTASDGAGITIAGLIISAVSIPLFISAAKNKKQAATLSFKNQLVPQLNNKYLVKKSVPSLSLKINIRG